MEPFSIERETVDLDAIYAQTLEEAHDHDGCLVHSRGLKHVLADLYRFDLHRPRRQLDPTRERLRKHIVDELVRRRWIRESERRTAATTSSFAHAKANSLSRKD